MAGGESAVAVRNAERAVELAATTLAGAARHRAKSEVVLAAALCSTGALDRARDRRRLGAGAHRPIGPATAALGGGLPTRRPGRRGKPEPIAELRAIRDDCARRVEHWGGAWRQL